MKIFQFLLISSIFKNNIFLYPVTGKDASRALRAGVEFCLNSLRQICKLSGLP